MSDDNQEDDDDKTLVTNIDEEPTVVIQDDKTDPTFSLDITNSPLIRERMDPKKIRSVAGTFKVYSLRGGKSEEYVFEGLRKKDYTEAEIKAGFEDYLAIKENYKPSFIEKLKFKLTNWLRKKK